MTEIRPSADFFYKICQRHIKLLFTRPHRIHCIEAAYCYRRRTMRGLRVLSLVQPMPFDKKQTSVGQPKENTIRWECVLALPGEYD